jgi:archaellum biogenesis ATPase FlaH
LIPNSLIDVDLDVTEDIETSYTYKLTEMNIQGYVDGSEALKQAVYKVLNTERFEYPIYSFSYGIDLESLIEKDQIYVKVELKRRIEECLLQDERIISIDNFKFSVNGDEILCTFHINSIFGEFVMTKEVKV